MRWIHERPADFRRQSNFIIPEMSGTQKKIGELETHGESNP